MGYIKGKMMHLPINTLLQGGKYRIIRFISSGGFGCTYEAEHVMFRKRVAIKEFFVKDFCGRDERTAYVTIETTNKKDLVGKLKKKFIDEARSIFDLHHPGIVRVTDVFEENETAYYVMDYIDGKSLKEIVDKEGALSESRALGYIRQVADALEYVHAHHRLHLDIKPGNIMIDGEDRAVLIDFGASKQYDEVNGENTSTLLGQTPGYAPPEQVGNDLVKFTPATDIYALGATLYKLLSGITPVCSSLRNSGDELEPLHKSISSYTCKAVEAAMKLNRHERTQSVSVFLKAIEERKVGWLDMEQLHGLLQRMTSPIVRKILILIVIIAAVWGGLELFYWKYYYPNVILPNEEENETKIENLKIPDNDDYSVATGAINGHEWIDLGLSVKWATMNVGASSPSDYGSYFAWGEIRTKSEYTAENSVTYEKDFSDISGNRQYDAARSNWGGSWRLPTKGEFEELIKRCKWTWTTQGGHKGYMVTGPNGNSIFLPAAGWRYGTSAAGVSGLYWSSMPFGSNTQGACSLYFGDGDRSVGWDYRSYGLSVRAVAE